MTEEPAVARAARFAAFGQATDPPAEVLDELAAAAAGDVDPRARAAAAAALVRIGNADQAATAWARATADPTPLVRRRAADLAPAVGAHTPRAVIAPLVALLGDPEVSVVEAAAWALGELGPHAVAGGAVPALATTATTHRDPLAREAAVAALGALGDPAGLPAILTACTDTTPVRRRAVLALAPYDSPAVDAALTTALQDRDWQVRQAAEDLTSPPTS